MIETMGLPLFRYTYFFHTIYKFVDSMCTIDDVEEIAKNVGSRRME